MGEQKVSLIVPVYNAESTIEGAIESVINQSIGFENIELILVDDCSSDNSRAILKEYGEKYSNIKPLFLEKNSGSPGKPRNVGIQNATTDYIMFLDQDDEYFPDAVEVLYGAITEDKSDFVMASYVNRYNKKDLIYRRLWGSEGKQILNPKNQEDSDKLLDYFAPWSKIYNRKFIMDNNIRFLENALHEDAYFCGGCVLNAKKVIGLPDNVTYMYNIHKDSTVREYSLRSFRLFLKGTKKFDELVKDSDLSYFNVMSYIMESLMLVFTNLNKADKEIAMKELIELENSLNSDFKLHKYEVNYLHNLILGNKVKSTIFVSEIYKKLYANYFIEQLYKKIVVKRVEFSNKVGRTSDSED